MRISFLDSYGYFYVSKYVSTIINLNKLYYEYILKSSEKFAVHEFHEFNSQADLEWRIKIKIRNT
jgi:hypothetical protein